MTPTEQDLACKLAEHPRWPDAMRRHGLGMIVSHRHHDGPMIVTRLWDDDHATIAWDREWSACVELATCVPMLDQPATQGCLLAMLRAEDMRPSIHCDLRIRGTDTATCIVQYETREDSQGPTLGEALARAVLAAWGEA